MAVTLTELTVTPGLGVVVAMYQVSETDPGQSSPTAKLLQRVGLNDSNGTELSAAGGMIVSAIYETTPTPVGSGNYQQFHVNPNGYLLVTSNDVQPGGDVQYQVQGVIPKPTITTTYSPTRYYAAATKTTDTIKANPAQLCSVVAHSLEATTLYWLQFFDKASAPATNDVPIWDEPLSLAADANHPVRVTVGADVWGQNGLAMTAGLAWGISSTAGKYTAAGTAANYYLKVQYY